MGCVEICDKRVARKTASTLKLFANETRLLIISALLEGEKQLKDIVEWTQKTYPSIVQHERVLMKKGIIKRKGGRYPTHYLANKEFCEKLIALCGYIYRL